MFDLRFHVLNVGAELVGGSNLKACTCFAILLSHLEPFLVKRAPHSSSINLVWLLVHALGLCRFACVMGVHRHFLNAIQDLAVGAILLLCLVLSLFLGHSGHSGLAINIFGSLLRTNIIGRGDVLEVARGLPHHLGGECGIIDPQHPIARGVSEAFGGRRVGLAWACLFRGLLLVEGSDVARQTIEEHVLAEQLQLLLPLHLRLQDVH